MKKKRQRPVLTLKTYETMFRVLHVISASVGNETGRACLFYNVIGSNLIRHHLRRNAIPVMGAALFRVDDDTDSILTLAHMEKDGPIGTPEAFHCWIECDGYAVDFTAPVFRESLANAGKTLPIPRKMFQRRSKDAASSWMDLRKEGDFWLRPSPELTMTLLDRFRATPAPSDLSNICLKWFQKPPKTTPQTFAMTNDLGEVTEMKLSPLRLSGGW